jgi:cytochrome c
MNQIKYIFGACLIFLMIFTGIFLYRTFPEISIVAQSNHTSEVNSSTTIAPVSSKTEPADTALIQQGKLLYNKNCLNCHGSFSGNDGPWLSLAGFPNRWPDRKKLFAFVRNPDSIIKVDTYAKTLIEKFVVKMKGSPNLSDKEIKSIFSFIENERTVNENR